MGPRWHPCQLHLSRIHVDCSVRLNLPGDALRAQIANQLHSTEKILDENPDLKQKWTSLIPQGKMGLPKDLMGPVSFLLSDAASYITGAELRCDGGYTST